MADELVIARADFDTAMLALLRQRGAQPSGRVAASLARCARRGDGLCWLAGRLMPLATAEAVLPVRLLPPQRRNSDLQAVLLVQLGRADEVAPQGTAGWQRWLLATAPGFRLLSEDDDPALVALWMDEAGRMAAAVRAERRWRAVTTLALPGRGMRRLAMQAEGTPIAFEPSADGGRYSRHAGALGAPVLQRLQASTIAIVGLGRTGSLLAHTLARAGTNLLLIDPDHVEPHNLDGDVLPQHEGLAKADAVARYLRPLLRPGALADARALDIAEPVCGALLGDADVIVSCVDDDRARLWAAAWATALLKPHLDVGVAVRPGGLGADIRLIVPGGGCLACVGGFADISRLPLNALADRRETLLSFSQQRMNSLRSWGAASAHLGLRLLEQLYAGTLRGSVFRRLQEDADGVLNASDSPAAAGRGCPLCGRLQGAGLRGVDAEQVHQIARDLGAGGWRSATG